MAGPKRSAPVKAAPVEAPEPVAPRVQQVQALEAGYYGLRYRKAGDVFTATGDVPEWAKVVKQRSIDDE